jgi:glycosyltransferase involved in cell wall biosynthesis
MVGGLENVVMDLAKELSQMGHQVTIITHTPHTDWDDFPFLVVRNPGLRTARKLVRDSDIFLQFNLSVKGLVYWLGLSTPLFISHQGRHPETALGRFKYFLANSLAKKNLCCSNYVAEMYQRALVIPNPYNHKLFRVSKQIDIRTKDLIFVGRLVSDKGVDVLLRALALLQAQKLSPSLTIVGAGPDLVKLQELCQELNLEKQVIFKGQMTGASLVDCLNEHRIMVVPSIWEEPFGIVALEGIATGCMVLGSQGGGLKDAIGECGLTFPNGDVQKLAKTLELALSNFDTLYIPMAEAASAHLRRHQRDSIAQAYQEALLH